MRLGALTSDDEVYPNVFSLDDAGWGRRARRVPFVLAERYVSSISDLLVLVDASGRFPILQPGYKGENPKRLFP